LLFQQEGKTDELKYSYYCSKNGNYKPLLEVLSKDGFDAVDFQRI
jgi:hypothetical protein